MNWDKLARFNSFYLQKEALMNPVSDTRKQSLNNLCVVSNDESNASAHYAAFAVKADQEGYQKVGSLFRALSRSEQINVANNTATMIKLGGTCLSAVEPAEVKSTVENLKAAIAIELLVRDCASASQMMLENTSLSTVAQRTLKFAMIAARGHIELLNGILEQIEHPDTATAEVLSHKGGYYVCPVCGFTAEKVEESGCAVCTQPRYELEMVN
jgi:rubrerythrin